VLSCRTATLHELQTVYSYGDLLDMLEAIQVGNYNKWKAAENSKAK
jgi:hypothetical protein